LLKQICLKTYDKIDYNKVPSVAGSKYRNAFYTHDGERYKAHVESAVKQAKAVMSGTMDKKDVTVKVNANVLYPHDIMHKYLLARKDVTSWDNMTKENYDPALEAMWYSLPDYLTNENSAGVLPIIDTSGSMILPIGGETSVTALSVALGFGMYFSERLKGEFKDHFINFSEYSKLNHVVGNTLHQKLRSIRMSDWGDSTNIQSAFTKILEVAVKNNLKQSELPSTLLIFSDMEFNSCGRATNLESARAMYESYGYTLPDVVFWSVNNRTEQVPAKLNDKGVFLVSGYSASAIKFITTGEITTPYELMLRAVNTPRYDFVDNL